MTKIALVTGAGSGIGRAVASVLANNDYTVVLAGRRMDKLQETATKTAGNCVPIECDVCSPESVNALFALVREKFGRLDVLFNNAGTGAPAVPLEELPFERWKSVIDTNLTGVFLCTQAAFRLMKEQSPQGGRIINNGSIAAHTPRPHMIPYTASKHAVSGITKTAALEGRQYNIACGQIDIGNTQTDLATAMSNGALQADMSRKVEPMFDVKHVADAVLYMANLPLDANVFSMTVMATNMPYVGRG